MTPVDVVVISGAFTLVGSLLAWFLARRDKREERRAASVTPGAPTVQQVWERQDRQERALGAALMLLAQVVEQHDNPHELILSKHAIKTLRETGFMPPELADILPGVE